MSLSAGISQTRKHCSRMPTTRLYVFHNEQVWTCPRGSLYSDVNVEQVWICVRGFPAQWISWVMVTCPLPPRTGRHKRKRRAVQNWPLPWSGYPAASMEEEEEEEEAPFDFLSKMTLCRPALGAGVHTFVAKSCGSVYNNIPLVEWLTSRSSYNPAF